MISVRNLNPVIVAELSEWKSMVIRFCVEFIVVPVAAVPQSLDPMIGEAELSPS